MAKRKPGEQARRDARARKLGYKSEYDYRAHGYGKRKPSEPRYRGKELRKYRGHTGAADLIPYVKKGNVKGGNVTPFLTDEKRRGFDISTETESGEQITWSIQGAQADRLAQAIKDLGPDRPLVFGTPKSRKALMGSSWDRRNRL